MSDRLNEAVEVVNEAEQSVKAAQQFETAQAELVSRSKAVGALLLEAKKQHPKKKDFEAYPRSVDGLGLSRAYDYLRLAGGRTTDEELKREARERQQKKRERDWRLPKSTPQLPKSPAPVRDVTDQPPAQIHRAGNDVDPVSSAERRKLVASLEDPAKRSAHFLAEFTAACHAYLPKITVEADREKAKQLVVELIDGRKVAA